MNSSCWQAHDYYTKSSGQICIDSWSEVCSNEVFRLLVKFRDKLNTIYTFHLQLNKQCRGCGGCFAAEFLSTIIPSYSTKQQLILRPFKIRMLEKINYAVLILPVLAPDRAPHNIQWTMIGSTLSLHWDPVVAMETESKVTGYLVCANLNAHNLQSRLVILNKHIYTFPSHLRCS